MGKKVRNAGQKAKVFPSKRWLAGFKESIPKAKPIDLRLLLREAKEKAGAEETLDADVIRLFRAGTKEQADKILTALNISRTRPDCWERAFFLLAHGLLGVGHLRVGSSRANQHAANWTPAQERILAARVNELIAGGKTEAEAIAEIAADGSAETFPYRPMKRYSNGYGNSKDAVTKRRAQALEHRYRVIKKRMMPAGLLRALAPELGSDLEELVAYLDKLGRPLG